jgi:hypothetical protein
MPPAVRAVPMDQSFRGIVTSRTRQLAVVEMDCLLAGIILRVNTDQNGAQRDITEHKAQHETKHES